MGSKRQRKTRRQEPLERSIQRDTHVMEDEQKRRKKQERREQQVEETLGERDMLNIKRLAKELNDEEGVDIDDEGYASKDESEDYDFDDTEAPEPGKKLDLGALVGAKLEEADVAMDIGTVSETVRELYIDLGRNVLAKYRSGKLPQAFHVLPQAKQWAELLTYTNPDGWSAQATCAVTSKLVSNLSDSHEGLRAFLREILLAKCISDINENKKLNHHYYQALRKALYKPKSFFRGVYLPLAMEEGNKKVALIIGSVVSNFSIPAKYSEAAMLALCNMNPNTTTVLLLRMLLQKRYALSPRTIAALVQYFGAAGDDRQPLVWQKSLLLFVQTSVGRMTEEQKRAVISTADRHKHGAITPLVKSTLSKTGAEMAEGEVDDL